MNQKSGRILLIAVLLSVLVAVNILFVLYFNAITEKDLEMINNFGLIRGGTQRITKLELNGIRNDEFFNRIDNLVTNAYPDYQFFIFDKPSIKSNFQIIAEKWETLKGWYVSNRQNPSREVTSNIIERSESLWTSVNSIVFQAQYIAENKNIYMKLLVALLILNLLILFFIVYFVKRYVQDKLEFLANHDYLTEVYNRSFFSEYLERAVYHAQRYQKTFAVILFDIDHFKQVNDHYGHQVGDAVLKTLTAQIMKNIRKSDIFSRVGGEEFAFLLPDADKACAIYFAEKIRKLIENIHFRSGKVTISLGVTVYRENDNESSLYGRADQALYQAKNNGRNMTEFL